MDYSLWIPQAVKVERAVSFVDGVLQDRTRAINTQRDLSSNIFLEDDVTILDVSIGAYSDPTASTLVVTTTPASKEKAKELLAANYYGGPILGLGSLRIAGMLRSSASYHSICRVTADNAPVKLWARPLFYVSALSSDGELPNSVDRAKQQLRLAGCCSSLSEATLQTLLENEILSPEESSLGKMVSGYLDILCDINIITDYRTTSAVQYWRDAALTLSANLRSSTPVSIAHIREVILELKELPLDRCLNLLKKQAKHQLSAPRYNKARKAYLKDEKKILEDIVAKPLAEYISQSRAALCGVELLVNWASGKSVKGVDAAYVRGVLAERTGDYSVRNTQSVLENLYLQLPMRPLDAVATFVLSNTINECRTNMVRSGLDLTTRNGSEQFIDAMRVGVLLPQDVKDQMRRNLDAFISDVAGACSEVLSGDSTSLANICAVLKAGAAGSDLLK